MLDTLFPEGGRIVRLFEPGGPGVRVDSGIEEGQEIPTFYDSLLAKLIVWGENRKAAIQRLAAALREYRIVGLPTSIPFHVWLVGQEEFLRGDYDTSFLADHFSLAEPDLEANRPLAALVSVLLNHEQRKRTALTGAPCSDENARPGWRSDMAWKLAGRREAMGS